MIEAFLDSLEGAAPAKTSGGSWFESHLPAFSAEEARLSGTVLDLDRRRSKHLGTAGRFELHGCKPVMVSGWAIGRS